MNKDLIKKYNVAGPRYTSYPPVPNWNGDFTNPETWINHLKIRNNSEDAKTGISIYIHLPFCESLCTYCGCNKRITVNHNVEVPYIEAVLKEWKMYLMTFDEKPLVSEFHLGGGTPTFFHPHNLKHLIETILNDVDIADNRQFAFEGHPNNTTKEHMQVLYDVGFNRMSLGIQDFDPKVQEIINRKQSFSQVQKVVKEARNIGYKSINFDLIYGLPLQTLESISMTIDLVKKLLPDRIALYSYAHVPWANPAQKMFTPEMLPDGDNKRSLYELSKNMLAEMGFKEIGMDHFALVSDQLYIALTEKRLNRNFMGYTTSKSKITIGLGVSAIGDTFHGYSQNTKKVEDYYKLINKTQLPVIKGHYLSEKERIARKHITELMCNMQTLWIDSGDYYFEETNNRLQQYYKDGIIECTKNNIRITKAGVPFVRNVCMAFDPHLWKNTIKETKPVYSKII
ncbi:oxygen-independent coproporphyrinogen III oxidase [Reichenbachiella versicolor]|uniref:oxygen-independent coproporphyrinogen III oxidase n=1 Tax=Reichenbachiella versicolor TaxID=1821036 RepID=UPI000D6DE930|nr:oxygen-independent coproporphyrinogen III oxidase [Reichenbachiella versicolor]